MIEYLLKDEGTLPGVSVCCTERNRKAAAAYLNQLAEAVLKEDVTSFDLAWTCEEGQIKVTLDPRFR